jgi:hypothetical protein
MRTLAIAFALLLVAPASALAGKTADFTFKSDGSATVPGAAAAGADGTFEDFPFTIAAGDTNGQISVEMHWSNPADDWDLVVYKKNATGGLDQVGSSAGGPPSTSEATTISQQGSNPVAPGDYVVRANNYLASSPDFEGSVKFTDFVGAPNQKPVAKLKKVKTVTAPKATKLDASGSSDSDGSIANYAWDLDGDGSIETEGGTKATLSHKFSVGVHHVTVRVTDDKGKRGYATRTIRVKAPLLKRRGNR